MEKKFINLMSKNIVMSYLDDRGEVGNVYLPKQLHPATIQIVNELEIDEVSKGDYFHETSDMIGISIATIEIVNLPEPQEGVYYIVSREIAIYVCRKDVITPGYTMTTFNENEVCVSNFITFAK